MDYNKAQEELKKRMEKWSQDILKIYLDDISANLTPEQLKFAGWYLDVKYEEKTRQGAESEATGDSMKQANELIENEYTYWYNRGREDERKVKRV